MLSAMVKFKMASLPVMLAKQEVPPFFYLLLIDSRHIHREGVSRSGDYGEAQNLVTSCFAPQTGSAGIFRPVID